MDGRSQEINDFAESVRMPDFPGWVTASADDRTIRTANRASLLVRSGTNLNMDRFFIKFHNLLNTYLWYIDESIDILVVHLSFPLWWIGCTTILWNEQVLFNFLL